MSGRLTSLAFDYEGDFAFIDKRIATLQDISYDQVCEFAKQTLSRKNFRRIAVMIEGPQGDQGTFEIEVKEQGDSLVRGNLVRRS